MPARVTIGIPTYQRPDSLRATVESCRAQTYERLEILVSDNASSDATQELCRAWADDDVRVRVLRQRENIGREANFRAVLAAASTELFMWLSDDDTIDPDFVERCVAELDADADLVSVGGTVTYDGADRLPETAVPGMSSDDPVERMTSYLRSVGYNGAYYSVMRREDALSAHYPTTLAGDWMFVAQIAASGKIAAATGTILTRDADGASSDMAALAQSFGLRRFWGRDYHLWATLMFVRALATGQGTFGGLRAVDRARALVDITRVLLPAWWDLSGRDRLGINRLSRLRRRLRL